MCQLSPLLKLCTCHTHSDACQLPNYWVLQRPQQQEAGIYLMGETLLPQPALAPTDELNSATLLKLLNTGQCFDKALPLCDGDLLELYFTVDNAPEKADVSSQLQYSFVYQHGQWQPAATDPFDTDRIDIEHGPIAHPFTTQQP